MERVCIWLMKKSLLTLTTALLCLAIFSCTRPALPAADSPTTEPPDSPATEEDEPSSVSIIEGKQHVFTYLTDNVQLHTDFKGDGLKCQSDQTWCTVRVDPYARPCVATAEVTSFWEEADEPRRATLHFIAGDKTLGTFLIIQDPLPRLEAPTLLSVPADGGKFRFRVVSNVYQVEARAESPLYTEYRFDLTNLLEIATEGHHVTFTMAPWDVTKEKPKPACIRIAANYQVKFVEIGYLDPDVSSDTLPYDDITNWD